MKPVRAVARSLLATIFVTAGAKAVAKPDPLVPIAKQFTDRITPLLERRAPWVPTDTRTLVRLNGAAQVVAGLMLATGRFRRPAALLLAGTLVPNTLAAHRFWEFEDPAERAMQRIQFTKNLGLLGGLLLAAADTEGRPGLAWRTRHLTGHARKSAVRAGRHSVRTVRNRIDVG